MNLKLIRFLPAVLWMGFIFYLSSRSTAGIPLTGTDRFLLLKTFHLIEYAVLTFFLNIGYRRSAPSAVTAYLYALTDEFHQTFIPGREGKFADTLIDILGILIGLFFYHLIFIKKNKKSASINL